MRIIIQKNRSKEDHFIRSKLLMHGLPIKIKKEGVRLEVFLLSVLLKILVRSLTHVEMKLVVSPKEDHFILRKLSKDGFKMKNKKEGLKLGVFLLSALLKTKVRLLMPLESKLGNSLKEDLYILRKHLIHGFKMMSKREALS